MTSTHGLPSGTVTLLFTDIEGSTQLLKQLRDRYGEALADHQNILREVFSEHGGHEIDTQGDSFFVAFRRTKDAVSASAEIQRRLAENKWPENVHLRVRIGIHTGEPTVGGDRYVGLGVHRGARICAAGHGGQVLISQTARELLRDDPIPGMSLRDLGEHQLKDMDEPEHLYQLVAAGLQDDFPALKTVTPPPFEGREEQLAEEAVEKMGTGWRRPGRRVLIGVVSAVVVVGVTLGMVVMREGGSAGLAAVGTNAVGVIDPESGKIVAETSLGGAPGAITAGLDAVWVANANENTVSRIDPSTNAVRQTIAVGRGPAGVAAGGSAVWVANGLEGTVSRIDPTINQVVGTPIRVGNGPRGVAYGEGAVWVTNSVDGTVSRIAPRTGRVTGTFPAVIGASGIAVGYGRVWVTSPTSASVVALDPGSGRVLGRTGVGGEPTAVAAGADAVWVANRADGTVSKLDPEFGAVRDLIEVGRGPTAIAASPDEIWVANGGDGTLSRIDPATDDTTKSVRLGNPPQGVALWSQRVYAAVRSTGIEHRGGTLRILLAAGPESLDPAVSGFTEPSPFQMTNDGLVAFRKAGGVEGTQLVPDLAVAIPTPTDGGKAYTFKVRSGIRYSNGKLVQPGDFKRALERVLTVGDGSTQSYDGIVGADRCKQRRPCDLSPGIVIDNPARTITFKLTGPDPDFLVKLALPFAFAVPPGTPETTVGFRPLPATGPYRIETVSQKLKSVRLVRNEVFREWSADAQPQGYPDSITFSWRSAEDSSARLRGPATGKADVALGGFLGFPERELVDLRVRSPRQLQENTLLATSYVFLNTRVSPFDDVRVRRAVNLAFDRVALADRIGRASTPTCQILPPNLPGYEPTCPYARDGKPRLDAARTLVRSSGTAGAEVTVRVPIFAAKEGRYMTSVLDLLGYRAKLVVDGGEYFATVSDSRSRSQTGFWGWQADVPSAANFLPAILSCAAFVPASPGVNGNPSGFCDPAIDEQMVGAATAQVLDPPAATTLWRDAEQSLLAQAPVVPMYNPGNVDVISKRVGNYQYNPQWGVLLDQLWVK